MEITVQQVELLSDDDYIYLDVRGEIAYQHGHIPKAYEWAGDFSRIEELPKDKRLIVYCNYGEKSALIAEQLRQEGYEAFNLSGGYREWLLHVTSQKEQMQDVSKDGWHLFSSTEELTPDEVKRYDRQIILPQVGSDGQKKLEELEESILTRRKEQESCEKKISGENDRLFSIMNTSSDTKEKLSRYAAMEEQLEIRNAEYNSRYISFNSELKEYNETAEELLKQQDAAKEAFEKQENLYQELEKREEHLQEKEQKYQDEMGNLNQEYLRTKSRYETLMNITERYDGYNQSIRRIMEQKNVNPGIIGVVADILALPEKYETAIEIALGGALQNIVTEDNETAKKMINFLKKNRFGRATFLPLTNIRRRNSTISPSVLQDEGVIGIASTLVKVEERFQALVDSLLGRTVVVDTVDHALSLSRKNNFSLRLVTLDGELLNPGGAITGGAFRHSGKA